MCPSPTVHPCSNWDHVNLRCNDCGVKSFSSLTPQKFPSPSHHPCAACVDVVFQVTQAVVGCDNPCKPAVQGQVRRLVSHQEQQALGLWSPTHRFLKERRKRDEIRTLRKTLRSNYVFDSRLNQITITNIWTRTTSHQKLCQNVY